MQYGECALVIPSLPYPWLVEPDSERPTRDCYRQGASESRSDATPLRVDGQCVS